MTVRPAFGAKAGETGVLLFDDPGAWHGYLRSLAGKRVRVTVARETKGRTLSQNSWLWGAIYPLIADWSGHTVDEIHEAMKVLHGPKSFLTLGPAADSHLGQEMLVPRSTAEYTTDEFSNYCERVRAWAATQGLNIPDPGQVGR